jgi:predicted Zn-dependent protease with MMP-like domain
VRLPRIALAAFVALALGLGAVSFWAPVPSIVVIAAATILVVVVTGALTAGMGRWSDPESEEEFDRVIERAERLAREPADEPDPDAWELGETELFDPWRDEDFQALVRSALDELPLDFHRALEHVAVVVSDGGRRRGAYGLYHGGGVARDGFADRIVIYRDTLLRDFGHDPAELRAQVTRTVRHELAHHLGWDEPGVRGLGL